MAKSFAAWISEKQVGCELPGVCLKCISDELGASVVNRDINTNIPGVRKSGCPHAVVVRLGGREG